MKTLLLAGAVLAAVGCASEPSAAVRVPAHKSSAEPEGLVVTGSAEPTTTTTEAPAPTTTAPTTTTTEPAPATTAAPRRTTTSTVPLPAMAQPTVHDADFWWRLALCESGGGTSSPNIFQFMGGTAEKVGYYPGASYEAQRAMAIDWASRIHPREGTTAGWPVCWWKAGGS